MKADRRVTAALPRRRRRTIERNQLGRSLSNNLLPSSSPQIAAGTAIADCTATSPFTKGAPFSKGEVVRKTGEG